MSAPTQQQVRALRLIIKSLLDTIAEVEPMGAPSGPMYAALMTQGCSLSQYQSITQGMITNGLVTAEYDGTGTPVLFQITDKGHSTRNRLSGIDRATESTSQ